MRNKSTLRRKKKHDECTQTHTAIAILSCSRRLSHIYVHVKQDCTLKIKAAQMDLGQNGEGRSGLVRFWEGTWQGCKTIINPWPVNILSANNVPINFFSHEKNNEFPPTCASQKKLKIRVAVVQAVARMPNRIECLRLGNGPATAF